MNNRDQELHAQAIKTLYAGLEQIEKETPDSFPYIEEIEDILYRLDDLQGAVLAFDLSEHLINQRDAAIEAHADQRAER